MARFPQRIVCLTEETVETLYLLGEQDRIVGVSAWTVRPEAARRDKPKVSAFTTARYDKILALEPDLVLAFSDIQADIARDLIKEGVTVLTLNHRSVSEILDMILMVGSMVGAQEKAEALIGELTAGLRTVRADAPEARPVVYFEEWDEPLISCIQWVSELIEIAGGEEAFPDRAVSSLAKGRIIADPSEVIRRAPDIIIGSWCGKPFDPNVVRSRPGWDAIPAIRNGQVHEIDSSIILQPGPAALTDGVTAVADIIGAWARGQ